MEKSSLVYSIFVLCGLYGGYTLHGIAHEGLYAKYDFKETFFLTFLQFLVYSFASLPGFIIDIKEKKTGAAPFYTFLVASVSQQLTKAFMNIAAFRLSYSTELLFRSCKLIPVLIGSMIFNRKIPSFNQIVSVLLLASGLIGVSYADISVNNQFDFIGVAAALISLFFDALSANIEERLLKQYAVTRNELTLKVYSIGTLFILALSLLNGEFIKGSNRMIEDFRCIPYLIGFTLFGVAGVQFQYVAISLWGAVRTVMLTSCRKGIAYIVSNVLFKNKRFSLYHLISVCALGFGLIVNIYDKSQKENANKYERIPAEAENV